MLRESSCYPTIGDFLAYQFITDINYSELTDFSEMDFVVPGPGARDGLRKCFVDPGGLNEPELIQLMADLQEKRIRTLRARLRITLGPPAPVDRLPESFLRGGQVRSRGSPSDRGKYWACSNKTEVHSDPGTPRVFLPPEMGYQQQDTRFRGEVNCNHVTAKERQMDFDSYQKEALRTDQVPDGDDDASLIVPMLGLAGETGQLLSEYKKHVRDGDAHHLYRERVSEELGDLLWYIANVASKFDLTLAEIASANLAKVKQRWASERGKPLTFDAEFPEGERLPRRFEVEMIDIDGNERQCVRLMVDGTLFGAELTDNAYDPDGYRFHDVFHFGYAACSVGRRSRARYLGGSARADLCSTRLKMEAALPSSKKV